MNKQTKLFLGALLILGVGYVYSDKIKEGFALSSGTVSDITQTDPNKFYYIGKRNKSNTITPAQNGGTECVEFPDTIYQAAPVVNATCIVAGTDPAAIAAANVDANYTLSSQPIKGNVLYARFFTISQQSSPSSSQDIAISGTSALLTDSAGAVYYTNQMYSLAPSWIQLNTSGMVNSVSLNKDGFKLGLDGGGKIWASYPFTTNNWSAESGGGFAVQYEAGNSVDATNPTFIMKFAVQSGGVLQVGVHGITGFMNMSANSLLTSSISVDGFFVSAIGQNDKKVYYIASANNYYSNGRLSQFEWTVVPGSEQIGGTGLAYISAGSDGRAMGVDRNGKLWKCNNIRTAQSASDWKNVLSNPSSLVFKTVCYKAGNSVIAAITRDNKLYIEKDIAAVFAL